MTTHSAIYSFEKQFTRTRIAPTPSGFLHLGNVLSFALTVAVAEKAGAKILLRIDDLDRERLNREYVQDIFDTLNFLEIPWDEGPRNFEEYEREYSQLHRLSHYRAALEQLKDESLIFACTCSRAQIHRDSPVDIYPGTCREKGLLFEAKDTNWRIKTDPKEEMAVRTLKDGIVETTLPAEMQDFIVRKKSGYPAYQLASVVDDLLFGVDLVVRGRDLWPSTLAQVCLASKLKADGFRDITFYHHALLTGSSGVKLSKSAGATSVKYLREQGKEPADVYSAIAKFIGSKERIMNWRQLGELTRTDT